MKNVEFKFDFKDIYSFLETLLEFNKEHRPTDYFMHSFSKESPIRIYVRSQTAYEVTFRLSIRSYSGMKKNRLFFHVDSNMHKKLIENKILPCDDQELKIFIKQYLHRKLIEASHDNSEINQEFIKHQSELLCNENYTTYIEKFIKYYESKKENYGLDSSNENIVTLPTEFQDIAIVDLTKYKAFGSFKKFISTSSIINVPTKNLNLLLEIRYKADIKEQFEVFLLKVKNEKISEPYKYGCTSLFCEPFQEKCSKLKWISLPIGEYKIAFNFDEKQNSPCKVKFNFCLVEKGSY